MMNFTLGLSIFLMTSFSANASSPAPPLYESVLMIGDDHVAGSFGNALDAYLRTIAVEVNSIGECGSTPANWIGVRTSFEKANCGFWQRDINNQEKESAEVKSRSIYEEIAKADPDLTVIVLGTYMLKSSRFLKDEESSVEKILLEVEKARSKCIWIGPPQIKKEPYASNYSEGVKLLKKWVTKNRCDFVDSSQFSKYKGKGGIEYQVAAGTRWASAVIREIDKINRPSPREQQQLNIDPFFPGTQPMDKYPR
ncbi:hypothetical protein [Bdellovibrio sp. HCB209]|uniref:hypothetical protein n=1 Tax=Bdellovibrio sp. HCB209 TaxID=3394354 RepID=UPI0039B3A546